MPSSQSRHGIWLLVGAACPMSKRPRYTVTHGLIHLPRWRTFSGTETYGTEGHLCPVILVYDSRSGNTEFVIREEGSVLLFHASLCSDHCGYSHPCSGVHLPRGGTTSPSPQHPPSSLGPSTADAGKYFKANRTAAAARAGVRDSPVRTETSHTVGARSPRGASPGQRQLRRQAPGQRA